MPALDRLPRRAAKNRDRQDPALQIARDGVIGATTGRTRMNSDAASRMLGCGRQLAPIGSGCREPSALERWAAEMIALQISDTFGTQPGCLVGALDAFGYRAQSKTLGQ